MPANGTALPPHLESRHMRWPSHTFPEQTSIAGTGDDRSSFLPPPVAGLCAARAAVAFFNLPPAHGARSLGFKAHSITTAVRRVFEHFDCPSLRETAEHIRRAMRVECDALRETANHVRRSFMMRGADAGQNASAPHSISEWAERNRSAFRFGFPPVCGVGVGQTALMPRHSFAPLLRLKAARSRRPPRCAGFRTVFPARAAAFSHSRRDRTDGE